MVIWGAVQQTVQVKKQSNSGTMVRFICGGTEDHICCTRNKTEQACSGPTFETGARASLARLVTLTCIAAGTTVCCIPQQVVLAGCAARNTVAVAVLAAACSRLALGVAGAGGAAAAAVCGIALQVDAGSSCAATAQRVVCRMGRRQFRGSGRHCTPSVRQVHRAISYNPRRNSL